MGSRSMNCRKGCFKINIRAQDVIEGGQAWMELMLYKQAATILCGRMAVIDFNQALNT